MAWLDAVAQYIRKVFAQCSGKISQNGSTGDTDSLDERAADGTCNVDGFKIFTEADNIESL